MAQTQYVEGDIIEVAGDPDDGFPNSWYCSLLRLLVQAHGACARIPVSSRLTSLRSTSCMGDTAPHR